MGSYVADSAKLQKLDGVVNSLHFVLRPILIKQGCTCLGVPLACLFFFSDDGVGLRMCQQCELSSA